jgi:hypothetical protein
MRRRRKLYHEERIAILYKRLNEDTVDFHQNKPGDKFRDFVLRCLDLLTSHWAAARR